MKISSDKVGISIYCHKPAAIKIAKQDEGQG